MARAVVLPPRLVGALIVLGVLVPLIGIAVVATRGTLGGLRAGFRGVEGVGEAASALATVALFAIPGLILQVAGLALLAVLLVHAGDRAVAPAAFALVLFALVLAVVEATFQGAVTAWAGEHLERTGVLPELFEPLRRWANHWLQLAYLPMGLLGTAGFGWAILETRRLPPEVGWFAVLWSLAWLALLPAGTPPATLFVPLLVIGATLLVVA